MFRKSFLLLALLALSLTACQIKEAPVQSSPLINSAESNPCEPDIRSFVLNFSQYATKTYLVKLETGPFEVNGCMCKVINYSLDVSRFSGNQWMLNLSQNTPVPYSSSTGTITDLLTVEDVAPIFEAYGNPGFGELFVKQADSSPIALPEMVAAGGLCIIENFDGNIAFPLNSSANSPVLRWVPGPTPDSHKLEVLIPIGITSPI